jgi:hypothetical protein
MKPLSALVMTALVLGGVSAMTNGQQNPSPGVSLLVFFDPIDSQVAQDVLTESAGLTVRGGACKVFGTVSDIRNLRSGRYPYRVIREAMKWYTPARNAVSLTLLKRQFLLMLEQLFPDRKAFLYVRSTPCGNAYTTFWVLFYLRRETITGSFNGAFINSSSSAMRETLFTVEKWNRNSVREWLLHVIPEANSAPCLHFSLNGAISGEPGVHICAVGEPVKIDARGTTDRETPQEDLVLTMRQRNCVSGASCESDESVKTLSLFDSLTFPCEGVFQISLRAFDGLESSREESFLIRSIRKPRIIVEPQAIGITRQSTIFSPWWGVSNVSVTLSAFLDGLSHENQEWIPWIQAPIQGWSTRAMFASETSFASPPSAHVIEAGLGAKDTLITVMPAWGNQLFGQPVMVPVRQIWHKPVALIFRVEGIAPIAEQPSGNDHLGEHDGYVLAIGSRVFLTEYLTLDPILSLFHPFERSGTAKLSFHLSWRIPRRLVDLFLSIDFRQFAVPSDDAFKAGVGFAGGIWVSDRTRLEMGVELFPNWDGSSARVLSKVGINYDVDVF